MHRTVLLLLLLLATTPLTAMGERIGIRGIRPTGGPTAGGTAFDLVGVGFDQLPAGTLGILFDGVPATSVTKASERLITGVTPPHPEGVAQVLISIGGQAYSEAGFERYRFTDRISETTTTTVSGPTSTSTTLPPECGSGASGCDDANRCTADACVPGLGCTHTLASGTADLARESTSCAGQPVPAGVGGKFVKACTLVDQAERAATQKKKRAALRKAVKLFSRATGAAARAARRKKDPLSSDCAAALAQVLGEAKAGAQGLTAP